MSENGTGKVVEYLTARDIVKKCGVNQVTVSEAYRAGKLECAGKLTGTGTPMLFTAESVDRWNELRKQSKVENGKKYGTPNLLKFSKMQAKLYSGLALVERLDRIDEKLEKLLASTMPPREESTSGVSAGHLSGQTTEVCGNG